jgi:hypothetical protein
MFRIVRPLVTGISSTATLTGTIGGAVPTINIRVAI